MLLAICVSAVALGGCETSNSLFGQSTASQPLAEQQPAPQSKRARVAIAPVIGPNAVVAGELATQLTQQLDRERIAVITGTSVDYTLRGYVVASKEKSRTKFSYIWDVIDPAGKRVHRITGEEIGGAVVAGDAWTAATPQIVQAIVTRASTSFAGWLPASPDAAVASATGASQAVSSATSTASVQSSSTRTQQVASTTTGSLPAARSVAVTKVVGAPGDGSQALVTALQRELTRNGLSVADAGAAGANRVEGKVVLGKPTKASEEKGGGELQPIQIQWTVRNSKGENLGTVSQKNEIKPGELDGTWGDNANAVAAAAVQGIIKLLDKQTALN